MSQPPISEPVYQQAYQQPTAEPVAQAYYQEGAYQQPSADPTYQQEKEYQRVLYQQNVAPKPRRSYGLLKKLSKVVAVAVIFGLVAVAAFQGSYYELSQYTGITTIFTTSSSNATAGSTVSGTAVSTATTVTDVSEIVENVMPSVVAVTNISYTEYRSMFGTQTYESTSVGSGFIISQDDEYLYIATNNHVVSGAESITITFFNEEAVPGTVKGTDSSVDLAVVAVAISEITSETYAELKVATLGDSDTLSIGESTVVIGNALGYGQSVTTGVVSALNREVSITDDDGNTITNEFIQTDAAVNAGNSGGVLLNMNGEVIGIVSAKYSATGVEGMGYAIPISDAKEIIEDLINRELVSDEEASSLGIYGVDVTSDISTQYDMPVGVYVSKVVEDSAAEAAGIKKGDVITTFNGRSVSSVEDIQNMLQYLSAGTVVEVTVAQAGNSYEETTIEVTLGYKNE